MSKLLKVTDVGVMPHECITVDLDCPRLSHGAMERLGMIPELIDLVYAYAAALEEADAA